MDKDWKLPGREHPPQFDAAHAAASPLAQQVSRLFDIARATQAAFRRNDARIDLLLHIFVTLGDRITIQAQTIEILAQRIDQLQTAPSLLINGKPLADCTADEIDAAISRLMTRP